MYEGEIAGFLKKAVACSRVSHAYLFLGPEGSGRRKCARDMTMALLCPFSAGGSGCGQCPDCLQVMQEQHPDFNILAPAGASIKIDQVRQMQKLAFLKPYRAERKVFLIADAHKMTHDAANSLLKTLEEPVEHTVFILLATGEQEILPTVVSRCQKVLFSEGEPLSNVDIDEIVQVIEVLTSGGIYDLLALAGRLAEDKKTCEELLKKLALYYRDLVVYRETGEQSSLKLLKRCAMDQISSIPALPVSLCRWDYIEQAKRQLSYNANTKMVLESLFLRLAGNGHYNGRHLCGY